MRGGADLVREAGFPLRPTHLRPARRACARARRSARAGATRRPLGLERAAAAGNSASQKHDCSTNALSLTQICLHVWRLQALDFILCVRSSCVAPARTTPHRYTQDAALCSLASRLLCRARLQGEQARAGALGRAPASGAAARVRVQRAGACAAGSSSIGAVPRRGDLLAERRCVLAARCQSSPGHRREQLARSNQQAARGGPLCGWGGSSHAHALRAASASPRGRCQAATLNRPSRHEQKRTPNVRLRRHRAAALMCARSGAGGGVGGRGGGRGGPRAPQVPRHLLVLRGGHPHRAHPHLHHLLHLQASRQDGARKLAKGVVHVHSPALAGARMRARLLLCAGTGSTPRPPSRTSFSSWRRSSSSATSSALRSLRCGRGWGPTCLFSDGTAKRSSKRAEASVGMGTVARPHAAAWSEQSHP